MEMIQDLLEPNNTEIRIREDMVNGVYVSGVLWVPVKSVKQSMKVFSLGEKNRSTSFTKLNAHSSRSHAVFMVKIEKRKKLTEKQLQKCRGEKFEFMTSSTLFLVDLAGSERVKKSKATNLRLDEAKMINFSLSALGNCIHALTEKNSKHVPFRDSKLTRLLQDSLGGNSKTSMIVTITPSYISRQETIMSLKFGSRAMKVENKPSVNKKVDYKMLSVQLQEEVDAKTDEIASLEIKLRDAYKNCPRCSQKDTEEDKQETEDDQNVDYKGLLNEKEKENQEFLQKIDEIIAEQEQEMAKLDQENKSKAADIQELKEALAEAKQEIEEQNSRIIQMSSEAEEKEASLSQAHQKEMQDLKERMKKVKKVWEAEVVEQVKTLETELNSTKSNAAKVQDGLQTKISSLESHLKDIQTKNLQLVKELESKDAKLLSKFSAEEDRLKRKTEQSIADSNAKLNMSMKNELSKLNQQLAASEAKIQKLTYLTSTKDSQLTDLQESLKSSQQELTAESLKKDELIKSLNQKLSIMQDQSKAAKNEAEITTKSLLQKLEQEKRKYEELQTQISGLKDQINSLKVKLNTQNEAYVSEQKESQEELTALKSQLKSQIEQIKTLKSDLNSSESSAESLQNLLEQTRDSYSDQISTLKNHHSEEKAQLEQEINRLKDKNQEIKRFLVQEKEDMDKALGEVASPTSSSVGAQDILSPKGASDSGFWEVGLGPKEYLRKIQNLNQNLIKIQEDHDTELINLTKTHNDQVSNLQNEITEHKKSLSSKISLINDLKSQITSLEDQQSLDKEFHCEQLDLTKNTFEVEINKLERKRDALQAQISTLEAKVEQQKNVIDQTSQDVKILETELRMVKEESKSKQEDLTSQILCLVTEKKELNKALATLATSKTDTETTMNTQLENKEAKITALLSQISQEKQDHEAERIKSI